MTDAAAERKRELRAEHRDRRRALTVVERARETSAVARRCFAMVQDSAPPAVASYLATGSELDLDGLHRDLWRSGLEIFLPRVAAPGVLTWHAVGSLDDVRPGAHGIREPDPGRVPATPLPAGALVLVPGVAFAADGHRLGQGGGYYDRFLASAAVVSVGVGFRCQRCDHLPVDPHDRRLDGLVLGGELVLDPGRRLQP